MEYEIYEKYLTGIIKDAILRENTTELPDGIDVDTLVQLIKFHKLSTLLYPLLKDRGIETAELFKEFSFWAAVSANQQYYLEKIKESFEAEKIRFVCIKGAYLKSVYPEEYMRSSNDLDIFVDDENTEKARDILINLGFKVARFSRKMQDDAYDLGRFVHVEIHRKLISNKCPWSEKCQEIVGRIVPAADGSYEYVMTKEDFYLHMIGHMAKHFKYSGCGIRMVLDVWVYLNKFGAEMDRKTLDERLKYCGLYTFEREIAKLVGYWFCGGEADKKTKILGRYIFESGIFGHINQLLATEMAANAGKSGNAAVGATKSFIHTLFLPYPSMCIKYPKLSKYPVLLPFYWIVRAVEVLLFKRNRITEEAKKYDSIDIEYAKQVLDFKKSLGL